MGVKERRLRDKIRRETEIIDAAETVIFSKGIQNATMDEIAQEAELGKATLYVYYKSKDEILLAIRERALEKLHEFFQKAVDSEKEGYLQVRAIGQSYMQFAHDFPNYYQFISLFEAVGTKIDVEQSEIAIHKNHAIMVKAIQNGIEDGSIRKDLNPTVISRCLWGMATGIMQMINMKGEIFKEKYSLSSEDFVDQFFVIVEGGLRQH